MSKDSVSITDHRTGKTYEIDLVDGALPAIALRQIKTPEDDFGLMTYDPAYSNTAACRSRITFIDGDIGILRYRGYPIEQLAEKTSFLDVAYLLLYGELPSADQSAEWASAIAPHGQVSDSIKAIFDAFAPGAHAMGMLIAALAALSTENDDSKNVGDPAVRHDQIKKILGSVATLGAYAMRKSKGKSTYLDPDPSLSYSGNFLRMAFGEDDGNYEPNPVLKRAIDVLLTLHADHEQNCSTSVMRGVGSSHADPYSSLAAAAAALYGPLHGGANEAVLRMLTEIGTKDAIPGFIDRVKNGETRLMGFGHRVYKNYDPRAKIIKSLAD